MRCSAWTAWGGPVKLVILESPYRALIAPLLAYIDAVEASEPGRPTTVVLAEFVPRHLWEFPLHNQTALRLKVRLFFRPNTVVVDVPFHLADPRRDRPRRVPDSARAAWREAALRSGRLNWLRGTDSNRRPSGYEPDELPLLHPATAHGRRSAPIGQTL